MAEPQVAPAPASFMINSVHQIKEGNEVLAGVTLEIAEGAVTSLIGPSGAGKTSLLRLLNRLDDPVAGEILYRARPIIEYEVRELRRRVGFVFQTPVMFPGTVRANILVTAELTGKAEVDQEEFLTQALTLAGVELSLADRDGERLSVGQKQRVNIARALMTRPEVLLMDEPTSALDPETADRLMETVRRLCSETGLTVVMITHRLSEARRGSHFTVLMENGRVVEVGATEQMFDEAALSSTGLRRTFLGSDK